MKTRSLALFICNFSIIAMVLVPLVYTINIPEARAATVTCSGSAGSPTAVDEASLSGDIIFSASGDGYCALDASISVASVLVESGVTLTHPAQGYDRGDGVYEGVKIVTTGNFEIESGASINVDSKGCQNNGTTGYGPDSSNSCISGGSGAATDSGRGAGHGGNGGGTTAGSISGTEHGSAINPQFFGSSGGDSNGRAGGDGGGLIQLTIGGNFTHNGAVSADGGDGYASCCNYAGGGGSGGAINIAVTGAYQGSSGTFSADGGRAGYQIVQNAGGGGAGRIALNYASSSYTGFDSSKISLDGGVGNGTGADGALGTGYFKDTAANDVVIYYGYKFDSDVSVNSFTVNSTTSNLYCDGSSETTPSIAATTTITLKGTMTCTDAEIQSFDTQAGTSMDLSGLTYTAGGTYEITATQRGVVKWTMNDAVPVALTSSTINGNVEWTGLSGLSMDSSSVINANAKGCTGKYQDEGWGPNASNICISPAESETAGFGDYGSTGGQGAGHGGTGGAGTSGETGGGATYNSETEPTLVGSGGGGTGFGNTGGAGGGLVRLHIDGTFTHNGTISADGGTGTTGTSRAGGGGSGGSIYTTINGEVTGTTGSFSADGGSGGNESSDGGGGGGGRVRVGYGIDSTSYLSGLSAATVCVGGTGPDSAADGSTGTLSVADIYGPSMSSATTADADLDGYIDRVVITLNETVDAGTVAGTDFTLSDSYSVASASRTASSEITLVVTEAANPDTGNIPTVTIAGSISDQSANATTSGSQVSTDGAKPQIYRFDYKDVDADGKIDTFDVNFSENIVDASVVRATDFSINNWGDFNNISFGGNTTDLASGTLNSVTVTLGTESTAVDTIEDSTNISFSTQGLFSVTDGTNTNNTLGAQSQATFKDEAGPVITSLAPADAETSVAVNEDIVVTFSEAIATGSATYSLSPDPGGASGVFSNGDKTYTLSHDDFDNSEDYTFTMTAAPDTASNALAGAIASVTHPATFTTAAPSGGGSVATPAPDPAISSGSDDTGSTDASDNVSGASSATGDCISGLNPGADLTVSWSSNSSVDLVNIYYSTDAGGSYTLIDGPIANMDTYNWTIPADIAGNTLQFKIEGTDLAEITTTFETGSCVLNGADTEDTDDEADNTDTEVTEPTTGEQGISPVTGELEDISVVAAGDYIRSSYFSTVYYIDSINDTLTRRPFMDAQTFFTYQDDFTNIKTVTDATLSILTIGSPMLPNPGVVLIKIQSDPKVYAIDEDGQTIRWIQTEEVANTLYGTDWSQYIIDIQATFFPRFTRGDDVAHSEDLNLPDKQMKMRDELAE